MSLIVFYYFNIYVGSLFLSNRISFMSKVIAITYYRHPSHHFDSRSVIRFVPCSCAPLNFLLLSGISPTISPGSAAPLDHRLYIIL